MPIRHPARFGARNPHGSVHHSNAANRFRLNGKEYDFSEYFVYSGSFGSVTASGGATPTQTAVVTIQNDSDFEWMMTTAYQEFNTFTPPLLDTQISQLTLQITDSGTGTQIFDRALPLAAVAGTGRDPFILPVSRFIKGNSSLQMVLTNLSATNRYDNVFVALHGRKLFQFG